MALVIVAYFKGESFLDCYMTNISIIQGSGFIQVVAKVRIFVLSG